MSKFAAIANQIRYNALDHRMESIVINPKTEQEINLVAEILEKMNIAFYRISDEEKEDLGLMLMMTEGIGDELISRDEIIAKLK